MCLCLADPLLHRSGDALLLQQLRTPTQDTAQVLLTNTADSLRLPPDLCTVQHLSCSFSPVW